MRTQENVFENVACKTGTINLGTSVLIMGGRCLINVTNYPNVLQIKAGVILNNYLWRLLARNKRFYSTILHAAY